MPRKKKIEPAKEDSFVEVVKPQKIKRRSSSSSQRMTKNLRVAATVTSGLATILMGVAELLEDDDYYYEHEED